MLPGQYLPVSNVRGNFYAWRDSGLQASSNQLLLMAARQIEGKEAQLTAGNIESQSAKTTDIGGIAAFTRARSSKGASVTSSPIRAAS